MMLTEAVAKTVNLVGEKITMKICTVNGTKTIDSTLYNVPIIDNTNKKHIVVAHQVDTFSEGLVKIDLSGVKNQNVKDKWESLTSINTGSVALLFRLDYLRLHAIELERQKTLIIVQSLFAKSLIIVCSHQLLKSTRLMKLKNMYGKCVRGTVILTGNEKCY